MSSNRKPDGYKEKVDDEQVLNLIDSGVTNSVGDFLNSSDMARERQKATLEYGMMAQGHLSPQGVSTIVSSDTVEAVEGYSAIISELMLNNNKLVRFMPTGQSPADYHNAKVAADAVNYVIFKQNPGWELLNTWLKSSLMWKNSIIRWEYIEDCDYEFETYDEISQENLDLLLSDDQIEIVGELKYDHIIEPGDDGEMATKMVYKDVRLRRKIEKTRIKLSGVHPEAFRITRDSNSIDEAAFVGIQIDMTRSEIRKFFPDVAEDIDWDAIGDGSDQWTTKYTDEQASRKKLVGEEYWMGSNSRELAPLEANRQLTVIECWIRVDRDGDGIAELKHFIVAGSHILLEEDVSYIPLACLSPFEVPHEFFGLSVADMIRPSTLATTAILRGFVENVYLTNYSPKLADPNVVDFSALQNMKPKQIIATNGNPMNAVHALAPDTISQGTVPLLEMLQVHKEQATGLSKAAQGLNDTLYVSGNSEEKMQRAMSAAQVRVQFMARRFMETGFKRLAEGIYQTMRTCLRGKKMPYYDKNNFLQSIDPGLLPSNMLLMIDADVGENSNSNTVKKMAMIGQQVLPALMQAGAGGAINPTAALRIACKTIEAMDLDPLDFLVDYTAPDFQAKAEQSRKAEEEAKQKADQLAELIKQLDIAQKEATTNFTKVQSSNAQQDNAKQLMVALDKSYQEWAKIYIDAAKEGVALPEKPGIEQLLQIATQTIKAPVFSVKPMDPLQPSQNPAMAPENLPQ